MSEIAALSQALGQRLMELGWTITTAESCTGGGISAAITEIAGSSNYFNCAFITYSNESKSEMVNVSAQSLVQHGAVSRQVVSRWRRARRKKPKRILQSQSAAWRVPVADRLKSQSEPFGSRYTVIMGGVLTELLYGVTVTCSLATVIASDNEP